jgi:hypothetical protein
MHPFLKHRHRSVVVAVIAVAVVEASVDEVIEMIAVRDLFVAAVVVSAGAFDRRAGVRVGVADFDDVFVEVSVVGVMKVSVVEVIDVVAVLNAGMTAGFAVNVNVVFVSGAV